MRRRRRPSGAHGTVDAYENKRTPPSVSPRRQGNILDHDSLPSHYSPSPPPPPPTDPHPDDAVIIGGKSNLFRNAFVIFLFATCLKFMLLPSYKSTDFDVHRNWLAITHSLPLKEWYHDATSEWTLDYPPFFAYFEYSLSQFAHLADENMLRVTKEPYTSGGTVMFQRLSVVVSDTVLFGAVLLYVGISGSSKKGPVRSSIGKSTIVVGLTCLNPGLLLVDHVHFQYNGMLLGLLVLSVALVRMEWNLTAAAVYVALVMFKHLFVICAPVYFVYMLRGYCFYRESSPFPPSSPPSSSSSLLLSRDRGRRTNTDLHAARFSVVRFLSMAATVVSVAALALVPVLCARGTSANAVEAEFRQLMSRLFPWGRGLVHAYWAPNIWALYSGADKVFSAVAKRLRIPGFEQFVALLPVASNAPISPSLTGGIVGDCAFTVLPTISATTTNVLMFLLMLPALRIVWQQPRPQIFLPAIVYCYFCYFLVGYHVHEKAIVVVSVLLGLNAVESGHDALLYWRTTVVGSFCLFPLLFEARETPLNVLVLLSFAVASFVVLNDATRREQSRKHIREFGVRLTNLDVGAGWLCAFTFAFDSCGLKTLLLGDRLPFLPLVLYSVFGALCLLPCWFWTYGRLSSRGLLLSEIAAAR